MTKNGQNKTTEEIAKAPEVQLAEGQMEGARDGLMAVSEVQGALVVAKQFPRDEDRAYAAIIKACGRPRFAEAVTYSFPRGGSRISGPSVKLAREMARCFGNMRYGFRVTKDTEEERAIEAFGWDTENNTWITAQDSFRKLIQRKRGGDTIWETPDERDLRELTFRRAAILIRNCILQVMPSDFVDDAVDEAMRTMRKQAKDSPGELKKNLIKGFARVNVQPSQIEKLIGHTLDEATSDELVELRSILQSLIDGNTTWSEHMQKGERKTAEGTVGVEDLKKAGAKTEEVGEEGRRATLTEDYVKQIRAACRKKPQVKLSDLEEVYGGPIHEITGSEGQTVDELFADVVSELKELKKAAAGADDKGAKKEPESEGEPEPEDDGHGDGELMSTEAQKRVIDAARDSKVKLSDLTEFLKQEYGTAATGKLPADAELAVLAWIEENAPGDKG